MIIVVARNFREADYWLTHQEPPINPRGKDVLILSTHLADSGRRLRGRRLQEGDRIVKYYKHYEGKYSAQINEDLDWLVKWSPDWKGKIEYA